MYIQEFQQDQTEETHRYLSTSPGCCSFILKLPWEKNLIWICGHNHKTQYHFI